MEDFGQEQNTMSSLNYDQKELIFDYSLGLLNEKQTAEAEALIDSEPEAAALSVYLSGSLLPLEAVPASTCPDELVDSTVERLKEASSGNAAAGIDRLLSAEQAKTRAVKHPAWRNAVSRLATAAMFMIVGTLLITSWNTAKRYYISNSRQQQCMMQLGNIFNGFNQYKNDHNDNMPSVATSAGSPWWKIGQSDSRKNHSNTRHMWLLVKEGYLAPTDFICPARACIRRVTYNRAALKRFYDFPDRRLVNYSFRLACKDRGDRCNPSEKALIADMSPVFETLPQYGSRNLILEVDENLMRVNSGNHGYRGQNILYGDGSVDFAEERNVGIRRDDIFTLRNIRVYHGNEMPKCATDTFLAP